MSLQQKIKVDCTPDQIAILKAEGVLVLNRSADQVSKWLKIRRGDILSAGWRSTFVVEARGFVTFSDSANSSSPIIKALALRVAVKGSRVEHESRHFTDRFTTGDYSMRVSQNNGDERNVAHLLNLHRYGSGSSIVKLLVMKSESVVGVALLDKYHPFMPNSTPSRNLPGYPMLCEDMYLVRRIVNSRPDIASSVHIQELCFRFCEILCSFLIKKDVVILVGNSYDFMVSAIRRGFRCAIPSTRRHPIFYWKPIRDMSARNATINCEEIESNYVVYKQQYREYKRGATSYHFRPPLKGDRLHGANNRPKGQI